MAETKDGEIDEAFMKAKAEKLDGVMNTNAQMIFKEVEKIISRSLTDEEKESLMRSVKVFFMITSLLMSTL